MNASDLTLLAYSKLGLISPRAWDVEAFESYTKYAEKAYTGKLTKGDLNRGWKEGLAMMKGAFPKKWDEYERSKGLMTSSEAVPWEKVTFTKGTTDGDFYSLTFDIDGTPCELECDDLQLSNPEYVIRKMQFRAIKLIDCPYMGSASSKKNWIPGAVFMWLKSDRMNHAVRENLLDAVKESILDYAMRPLDFEAIVRPWDQIKDPIREGGFIYMPSPGLSTHVHKMTGREISRKLISTALSQLGAEEKRKGFNRKRFFSILYDKVSLENSETGIGEDIGADKAGAVRANKGWDGKFDDVRPEERGADASADGLAIEGAKGKVKDTDDTLSSVAPPKTEGAHEPFEVPF
uniref:Uncharacterized protein n=1 Tax=viral metagenome TaxID=1070528 RepID=A0A6M3KIY0_9ZZZZ